MATYTITHKRAKELLNYNPTTGELTWLVSTNRKIRVGAIAGSIYTNPVSKKQYLQIKIEGVRYIGHRFIWFLHTGDWPINQVDHWDGCSLNNVWTNLRDITSNGNQQNRRKADSDSSTGLLGASFNGKRYTAQITVKNKHKYIGTYDTAQEAHEAYLEMKRKLHASCTI